MKIGDLFRKQSQTKAFPSQDNVSFYCSHSLILVVHPAYLTDSL